MEITFVSVEPAVPENIGASARALKTMGFNQLYLVNPCNHLSKPARWLAHASNEILEEAQVFSTLEQAIAGFDYIVGTTAKKRSVKADYPTLPELKTILTSKGNSIKKVAVVFGREESGLSNKEMKLCDTLTTVALKTTYPSLNLAQAVMLYAYELSQLRYNKQKPASRNEESFMALKDKVKRLLLESGFNPESNIYPRFLERINFLGENDIHLLHSFCNKLLQNKK
ncbi:tRNA/rRNA methyltransferase [uncultured Draconibacterium sp.]|uniref:tRNA/rRNA methyltransferase n=1 Tax=uncultured Draconibacterium sp. TaxID=1573823 RepID=UPI0025DB75B6|nr:tRNA/rRNA methyltransferase [uncultured Draconibacterium sp.]